MKKLYVKPVMECEAFVPNEFIAVCYNYEAMFHCSLGENHQESHGDPCANTYVEILDGVATGHESGSKWSVQIYDINFGGYDISEAEKGDIIRNIKWTSDDTVNHTGTYYHRGWCEITSQVAISQNNPNAS